MSHATTGYSQWKKLGGGSIRSTSKSDLPATTVRIEELRDALLTGTQPSTVFEESSFTAGLDQALSFIASDVNPKGEKERQAEMGNLLDTITASVTALDVTRGGSTAGK
jgi:hypothetical protein